MLLSSGAPHAEVTYQGIGLVQARLVKRNTETDRL